VNLASRLEQANKFYGTKILVNEDTARLAGDELAFREIDSLRVAGKMEPARVFELMGQKGDLSQDQQQLIEAFERGLAAYRKQDWDAAEASFREGLNVVPSDPPSKVFMERIVDFRKSPPPPGWDGVWIATHK
jgi:adenylate cyclase